MRQELNIIMLQEIEAVRTLLLTLEEQHKCIIVNDIFALEACVGKIKESNKSIAYIEVQRRNLTQGRAMTEIIEELRDESLESNYHKIKQLLQEVLLQKDTNELLIKQGLSFTTRILNVLNPGREKSTYNARGKINK